MNINEERTIRSVHDLKQALENLGDDTHIAMITGNGPLDLEEEITISLRPVLHDEYGRLALQADPKARREQNTFDTLCFQ